MSAREAEEGLVRINWNANPAHHGELHPSLPRLRYISLDLSSQGEYLGAVSGFVDERLFEAITAAVRSIDHLPAPEHRGGES